MKKYTLAILILAIIPSVVSAAWWNPIDWFSSSNPQSQIFPSSNKTVNEKSAGVDVPQSVPVGNQIPPQATSTSGNSILSSLEQENVSLKSQVAMLKAKLSDVSKSASCPLPQASTPALPVTQTPTATTIVKNYPIQSNLIPSPDFSTYQQVLISDYVQNPYAYANKPIVIVGGTVTSFIPYGSAGYYDAGYVVIGTSPYAIMLRLSSLADYTTVANRINVGLTNLIIWGTGTTTSQQFHDFSSTGVPYNAYLPVLNVDRINQCRYSNEGVCNKNDTDDYSVFSK